MARSHAKCTLCEVVIWFGDCDKVPQESVCICGGITLKESGAEGSHVFLTEEEVNTLE